MNEDKRVQQLIYMYSLDKIEFTYTVGNIFARAIPHGSNPIVEERRTEKLSKLEGGTTLVDMNSLMEECYAPIARSSGHSQEDCINQLERELKKVIVKHKVS